MAKEIKKVGFFRGYFGKLIKFQVKEFNWKEWVFTAFIVLFLIGMIAPDESTKGKANTKNLTAEQKVAEDKKAALTAYNNLLVISKNSTTFYNNLLAYFRNGDADGMNAYIEKHPNYLIDQESELLSKNYRKYFYNQEVADLFSKSRDALKDALMLRRDNLVAVSKSISDYQGSINRINSNNKAINSLILQAGANMVVAATKAGIKFDGNGKPIAN